VGWEEVRQGWEQASAAISSGPADFDPVEPPDLIVLPLDEKLAYTIGTENIKGSFSGERLEFEERATNIYRLENGEWKMVSHHVDALPPHILQKLMGQG
jgi:ketosteroid isomerase-like protein